MRKNSFILASVVLLGACTETPKAPSPDDFKIKKSKPQEHCSRSEKLREKNQIIFPESEVKKDRSKSNPGIPFSFTKPYIFEKPQASNRRNLSAAA